MENNYFFPNNSFGPDGSPIFNFFIENDSPKKLYRDISGIPANRNTFKKSGKKSRTFRINGFYVSEVRERRD